MGGQVGHTLIGGALGAGFGFIGGGQAGAIVGAKMGAGMGFGSSELITGEGAISGHKIPKPEGTTMGTPITPQQAETGAQTAQEEQLSRRRATEARAALITPVGTPTGRASDQLTGTLG